MSTGERPLYWHQGIFLQPQHFQLLDRNCQALLDPYRNYMLPHFWGVASMEIADSALGRGVVELRQGNFVFPDGTHVSLPGNALVEARCFDQSWMKDGKPLTIYLGLKNWSESGENVTVVAAKKSLQNVPTRFIAEESAEDISDLHGGGSVGQVRRLDFVLKLFWETERATLGDFQLIPLAQLEKFGAEVRLSQEFIPPSVSWTASGPLRLLVEEIRDQITARAYQLEEHKSKRGVHTAEFGSRDMAFFLALRSINRYVPILFHYSKERHTHPWHIYGVLRQLIGELTTFSDRVSVLGELATGTSAITDYNHEDLCGCFAPMQNLITSLLDEITAGPEYVIRLIPEGNSYVADLKPAIFEGRNRYYLAVKTDAEPTAILQCLEDMAKLSSKEHQQVLVTQALPGIGLGYIQIPPQELPRRVNTFYFTVNHHDDLWMTVMKSRSIALYWHNAPADTEIELMVVGR
jgi:type VI secretion system protein ImpJ